jgi:hypothetical protein
MTALCKLDFMFRGLDPPGGITEEEACEPDCVPA